MGGMRRSGTRERDCAFAGTRLPGASATGGRAGIQMDMRHSTPEEADRFRADVSARELASERDERLWRRFTQVAIIIIALVVLAGALVAARAILIPIVAAVIIGSVIGPAIEAMGRRGIPTLLGSFLIVALLCALFYGIAAALAAPLADWINRAPEIGKLMQERFDALRPALRTITSFIDSIESIGRPLKPPLQVDVADSTMLQSMVSVVTPAIGRIHPVLRFAALLPGRPRADQTQGGAGDGAAADTARRATCSAPLRAGLAPISSPPPSSISAWALRRG